MTTDIDKPLVDDLADVLARTVVGWESVIGHDLSQAPEVQRVMARYRQEKDDWMNVLAEAAYQKGYDSGVDAQHGLDAPALDLGARAAKLVADMLQQAGRYLTHGYGEINEVLYEARQRGWLEPIE